MSMNDHIVWQARASIYRHFAETGRAPSVEDTARQLGVTPEEATDLYRALHERHAVFLEAGTTAIRIANPFSAVPTPFLVHAGGRDYWANCAWDSLGIAAALHADAVIEAVDSADGTPLTLAVRDARVDSEQLVAHFLVPFDAWYNNMVYT